METLILIAGGISIAVCMYASMLVLRNAQYDWRLKLMQLAIVWFVPLVGGYLVAYVARRAAPRQALHPDGSGTRTGHAQHDISLTGAPAPALAGDPKDDSGPQ